MNAVGAVAVSDTAAGDVGSGSGDNDVESDNSDDFRETCLYSHQKVLNQRAFENVCLKKPSSPARESYNILQISAQNVSRQTADFLIHYQQEIRNLSGH